MSAVKFPSPHPQHAAHHTNPISASVSQQSSEQKSLSLPTGPAGILRGEPAINRDQL